MRRLPIPQSFVVLALVAPVLGLAAGPAAALSCAAPDTTAAEIIAGDPVIFGSRFFDTYDWAIIGTVTAVETDETAGGSAYGRTHTTFEVAAVHGNTTVSSPFVVTSSDPGWLAGWPFEVGSTYFVPVQAEGPDGQSNYSFLCDPIFDLDPADIDGLIAAGAVPVVVDDPPRETVDPAPKPPVDSVDQPVAQPSRPDVVADDDASLATATTVVMVAALALAAAAALAVFTRRRPSPA